MFHSDFIMLNFDFILPYFWNNNIPEKWKKIQSNLQINRFLFAAFLPPPSYDDVMKQGPPERQTVQK